MGTVIKMYPKAPKPRWLRVGIWVECHGEGIGNRPSTQGSPTEKVSDMTLKEFDDQETKRAAYMLAVYGLDLLDSPSRAPERLEVMLREHQRQWLATESEEL